MKDVLAPKLLILASAGSGKTYQLSNRIIGLVARGVDPERIVALTFTRKAASEFADSVLNKLAKAAQDPETAKRLEQDLGLSGMDTPEILNRISRSLHRITLGTMDSFFTRIVKAFQYELGVTGGRFDLIEGPRQEIAADGILQHILGDAFGSAEGSEFSHAFRRATIGKEQQGVARNLREFIKRWHQLHRHHPQMEWGPNHLVRHKPEDWERSKGALIAGIRDELDSIEFTRKGQREALEKTLDTFLAHTVASGTLNEAKSLTQTILEAVATQAGENLRLKYYKEFDVTGVCAAALRKLVRLAADCELAAATQRTHALQEVIAAYDTQCERLLRSRGRLGFDDVKLLMGRWAHTEEDRLRREAIDFRLDARIDHWLLDEFQDTSPAEWSGLLPLIDEAASDGEDRTLFIVGDRKQAIYAWRGGDVTLFDRVMDRYGSGLSIEQLDESWRSCPEVLTLVNQVCGDRNAASEIFGEVGREWNCPIHESAAPLRASEKRGHAQVEHVSDWNAKVDRMEELLHQLGVGTRQLTCGILLRGNEKAQEVANELRARGFDVILEGQREPAKDCLVGVALTHLFMWLADPGHRLARGVVEMSPFHAYLQSAYGESWNDIWHGLIHHLADQGYRKATSHWVDACGIEWSAYSQRRIDDILQALGEMEHQPNVSCREVSETLQRLTIPQAPGVAAIQVMTIHKSKGLGFDVVILPEIPNKAIPEPQHYKVMQSDAWLNEAPPQWARRLHPELSALEEAWGHEQQHEAMCTLYVALTRAKRGLYVFLDEPSDRHDYSKASLDNWMRRATGLDAKGDLEPLKYGTIDWVEGIPELSPPSPKADIPELIPAAGYRQAGPHSSAPSHQPTAGSSSTEGMQFGQQVHALLEQIGWLDESPLPSLPNTPVGHAVQGLLDADETRRLLIRGGRNIRLLREQAVDALVEGQWVSGIIDRLHLHQNSEGAVEHVEIIDFKTDVVEDLEPLKSTHQGQLHAYRQCLQRLYPDATVECVLLSTHLAQAVVVQ